MDFVVLGVPASKKVDFQCFGQRVLHECWASLCTCDIRVAALLWEGQSRVVLFRRNRVCLCGGLFLYLRDLYIGGRVPSCDSCK